MRHNYQPQENEEPGQIPAGEPRRAPTKGLDIIIRLLLCLYILDIIPLCGLIHNFIFKQDNYIKQIEGQSLRSMSENLKADPIMDVQILDHGSDCPDNFETWKLGTWPGTVAGCLCDNGDLHSAPCEKVDSPKCKKDIQKTYPIEMYEWEYSIWCIKRAALGTDYLKQAECPVEYKECYPGGCFKGDCPVTKLEMTSTKQTTNKFNNKEKYLALTKTQGEFPLINIQITLNDLPCFTQELFNQTIKNSSYELWPLKEEKCDKYGLNSQFSAKLDSQTASQAFAQNYFTYSVTSLPHFKENANSTIALLSWTTRMRTAKNDHCLYIDEKFANSYINASESFLNFLPIGFITVVILMSLSLFHSLIFEGHLLPPKEHKLGVTLLFWIHFLSCIFILAQSSQFPRVYQSFQAMKAYIERYNSLGCFAGDQGSLAINDYLQIFREIEARFWVNFVFIFMGGLHILILIVFYFVKKRALIR